MNTTTAVESVEDLTPETVTTLLIQGGCDENTRVDSVSASPVGAGQMARSYRLQLSYSTGSGPSSVVAKFPSPDEASRAMAVATSAYVRESSFYSELAPHLAVTTPRCFASQVSADGSTFVILLEDVAPTVAVDQIAGATSDQASSALGQAAALHASSWGSPLLKRDWLPVEQVWGALAGSISAVCAPWLDRFGKFLTSDQVTAIEGLSDCATAWAGTLTERRSLWHGDFRLDNMLYTPDDGDRAVKIIDWQSVATGPGTIDVSYFLGNSLTSDARAANEKDLVADYHQRLVSHGVTKLSFDDVWREYRLHSIFGLVLIVPISMGVEATPRGDAMFGAMAARAACQVTELEAQSLYRTM